MPPFGKTPTLRVLPGGAGQTRADGDAWADGVLLEGVRAGKRSMAVAFHDRLRPIVDRTLSRLLGGRDPDYDDLAQLALIELVLSVDRFRGDCPLDAWASLVTARVVYKHIRRRKAERKLFVIDRAELPDVADRTTPGQVSMRSAIRRVESHLREIDSRKAWTFVLHDVHGYDLKEVAEITGASRAATQSRLVRGRKELHERIACDPDLAAVLADLEHPRARP
jgi:RNA polymerase sigma factor (sigma-70 family)